MVTLNGAWLTWEIQCGDYFAELAFLSHYPPISYQNPRSNNLQYHNIYKTVLSMPIFYFDHFVKNA